MNHIIYIKHLSKKQAKIGKISLKIKNNLKKYQSNKIKSKPVKIHNNKLLIYTAANDNV